MTRTPTPEQQAVLDANDRVRLVRAAPGSGKTWLVGEIIRRELASWRARGGIVALSHTHVARQAIESATGSISQYPHFVGTLDSFLYQYVVRPYAHALDSQLTGLRITPEEVWDAFSSINEVNVDGNYIHPQLATFMPPPAGQKIAFRARTSYGSILEVTGYGAKTILNAKQHLWRKLKRISYSDANFLAYHILARTGEGPDNMRALLARRFPFIVVDELQDTNWLVARAMNQLLARSDIRAVVVGDPDQAIYGFSGATPEIFDEVKNLPGAKEYSLLKTQRCAREVCRAAAPLLDGTTLESDHDGGTATVIVYEDAPSNVDAVLELVRSYGIPLTKPELVVRGNDTVERLRAGEKNHDPDFKGSPPIRMLFRGVRRFLQNERDYLPLIESALGRVLFDDPRVDPDSLRARGIDPEGWRREATRVLLDLASLGANETVQDWGLRAKARLIQASNQITGKPPTVKAPNTVSNPPLMSDCIGHHSIPSTRVRTVHQAKGETHDDTIYYLPPLSPKKCPSAEWWKTGKATEEARVAYVAATRPKKTFALVVHKDNWQRIASARPAFASAATVLGPPPKVEAPKGLDAFL